MISTPREVGSPGCRSRLYGGRVTQDHDFGQTFLHNLLCRIEHTLIVAFRQNNGLQVFLRFRLDLVDKMHIGAPLALSL